MGHQPHALPLLLSPKGSEPTVPTVPRVGPADCSIQDLLHAQPRGRRPQQAQDTDVLGSLTAPRHLRRAGQVERPLAGGSDGQLHQQETASLRFPPPGSGRRGPQRPQNRLEQVVTEVYL